MIDREGGMSLLSEEVKIKKLVEGLCFYINQLELNRFPVPLGFSPHSFKMIFELFFTDKHNYFVKNNPELYKKTQKDLNNFYTYNLKSNVKYTRRKSLYWNIWILVVIGVPIVAYLLLNLSFLNTIMVFFLVSIPSTYLYIVWANTTQRRILGKKYDNDIKEIIQELIEYSAKLIAENNINPENFPLKLRHDDYDGLVYEKKGKNKFVGVFKK